MRVQPCPITRVHHKESPTVLGPSTPTSTRCARRPIRHPHTQKHYSTRPQQTLSRQHKKQASAFAAHSSPPPRKKDTAGATGTKNHWFAFFRVSAFPSIVTTTVHVCCTTLRTLIIGRCRPAHSTPARRIPGMLPTLLGVSVRKATTTRGVTVFNSFQFYSLFTLWNMHKNYYSLRVNRYRSLRPRNCGTCTRTTSS